MNKIKQIIKPENLLSFFIIICPILDILSFLYRNKFNTSYSISTFIRPIIPITIFVYIFFKKGYKDKLKLIGIMLIYLIYAIIHLYLYNSQKTNCTYGTILHEIQYLVNYSFMILNLYIFKYVFNNENNFKLQKSTIISTAIYIISIYIAIITKTSSTTYIEGMGFKGWIESGNSLSTILVLNTFVIMSFIMNIKEKKIRIIVFSILMLTGVYMVTLIGTRGALIGFGLAILCFTISQVFETIIKKSKISKNKFLILIVIMILLSMLVVFSCSITVKRRIYLKNMQSKIIDESTQEVSNLTGDLTLIRNKIMNKELEENFMSKEQQQSILDLYDIAKKYNISNTSLRMQQFIYHCMLLKNQNSFINLLFGNGYLINTNELVLEMELPAILFNFGIIGFTLYLIPFIILFIKAFVLALKQIKKIDTEFIMLFTAVILSFVFSTLSGYTYFNSSSMIMIIVANILLRDKMKRIKE